MINSVSRSIYIKPCIVDSIFEKSRVKKIANVTSWQVDEGKFAKKSFSLGAGPCCMVHIGNSKTGYFCHSIPFENSKQKIKKTMNKVVDSLTRHFSEPVEAVLSGACFASETSMKQAETFMKTLDNLKVKYSAVLGRKSMGGTDMFVSIPQGKCMIGSDCDIKSMEELNKVYDTVIKADGHEFIF